MVYQVAYSQLDTFLYANEVERSTLSQLLATFEYDTFKDMQMQWLKTGRMMWYSYGNLSIDQSKQIVEQAVQLLNLQTVAKEELPDLRIVDLSTHPGNFHRLDFSVPDPKNENSCLVSYFQYGHDDGLNGGKLNLLNQLAMQYLQEPTFDQLRTKEQLGYVVFSQQRKARDVISAWFLIQSPKKDCLHIRTRLDIHLAKMRTKMAALTDEEFTTVVSAVNTSISEKDKNLGEEFGRFWGTALGTHTYNFDRQENDIAMLSTLTKPELQAFFEQFFFQPNRANRLDMHWNTQVVQAAGEGNDEESKEEEVKEAA